MGVHGAVSKLVKRGFDEGVVRETAVELRQRLGSRPALGLVFATPDYAPHVADFLEIIRLYGHVPVLVGSTGAGLVGSGEEMEGGSGFSLMVMSSPGTASAFRFTEAEVELAHDNSHYWNEFTGIEADQVKGWLVLGDPSSLNVERWIKQWNQAYPGIPTFGGLAAAGPKQDSDTGLFYNDRLISGGIAVALQGDIVVQAVVSQGCKPIGEPLTITQAQRNILLTLGSRPAYQVLSDVYKGLTDLEREQARGLLFAGLAVNEYLEEYKRGDFLVRSIIGADPNSGAVVISADARVGQTVQYQLRDPEVASTELKRLLELVAGSGKPPFAGILCTCIGRGRNLFRKKHHDAGMIESSFPGLPLVGLFTNVEIGPVGDHTFTHGHSASIALIAPK